MRVRNIKVVFFVWVVRFCRVHSSEGCRAINKVIERLKEDPVNQRQRRLVVNIGQGFCRRKTSQVRKTVEQTLLIERKDISFHFWNYPWKKQTWGSPVEGLGLKVVQHGKKPNACANMPLPSNHRGRVSGARWQKQQITLEVIGIEKTTNYLKHLCNRRWHLQYHFLQHTSARMILHSFLTRGHL